MKIINLQIQDNTQAVALDIHCNNVEILNDSDSHAVRSQRAIGEMLVEDALNETLSQPINV